MNILCGKNKRWKFVAYPAAWGFYFRFRPFRGRMMTALSSMPFSEREEVVFTFCEKFGITYINKMDIVRFWSKGVSAFTCPAEHAVPVLFLPFVDWMSQARP